MSSTRSVWIRSNTMDSDDAIRLNLVLEDTFVSDVLCFGLEELGGSCFPSLQIGAAPQSRSNSRERSPNQHLAPSMAMSDRSTASAMRVRGTDLECIDTVTMQKLSNRTLLATLVSSRSAGAEVGLDLILQPKGTAAAAVTSVSEGSGATPDAKVPAVGGSPQPAPTNNQKNSTTPRANPNVVTPRGRATYRHIECKVKTGRTATPTSRNGGQGSATPAKSPRPSNATTATSDAKKQEHQSPPSRSAAWTREDGGPCGSFEPSWGRTSQCRRCNWNRASHPPVPKKEPPPPKPPVRVVRADSPRVAKRTNSAGATAAPRREASEGRGFSKSVSPKRRTKSPPPPMSPMGDGGLMPKLMADDPASPEASSPLHPHSHSSPPGGRGRGFATGGKSATGTTKKPTSKERHWKTHLNDFADAASPSMPRTNANNTKPATKSVDRNLAPLTSDGSGRRRSVQFNEGNETGMSSPSPSISVTHSNTGSPPTSSLNYHQHDHRNQHVGFDRDSSPQDGDAFDEGEEDSLRESVPEGVEGEGEVQMNYQFPPPAPPPAAAAAPQQHSDPSVKIPVTASMLEHHNHKQQRSLESSPTNKNQAQLHHNGEGGSADQTEGGNLTLLEQYEIQKAKRQAAKAEQEQQSAAARGGAAHLGAPGSSSGRGGSPYSRRRQSIVPPSLVTSKELVMCIEVSTPVPTAFYSGSSGGSRDAGRIAKILKGTSFSVRVCWQQVHSFLDLPSLLALATTSRQGRILWQQHALTFSKSLVSLEMMAKKLTPAHHEQLVRFVLESQTTISRDVFRVINVVCELVRGSRCSTFEDCTVTLQDPNFLKTLLGIKIRDITQVSRDANAAVLRRVSPQGLPAIVQPVCDYLMAMIGLNKSVQGAHRYLENYDGGAHTM